MINQRRLKIKKNSQNSTNFHIRIWDRWKPKFDRYLAECERLNNKSESKLMNLTRPELVNFALLRFFNGRSPEKIAQLMFNRRIQKLTVK